jgi:hypothetical protein
MYTISRVLEGIILTCRDCTHIERVSQFNLSLGSQRTQAAQAMQAQLTPRAQYGSATRTSPEQI